MKFTRLCSRLTALWRYINFVLLLLLLLLYVFQSSAFYVSFAVSSRTRWKIIVYSYIHDVTSLISSVFDWCCYEEVSGPYNPKSNGRATPTLPSNLSPFFFFLFPLSLPFFDPYPYIYIFSFFPEPSHSHSFWGSWERNILCKIWCPSNVKIPLKLLEIALPTPTIGRRPYEAQGIIMVRCCIIHLCSRGLNVLTVGGCQQVIRHSRSYRAAKSISWSCV